MRFRRESEALNIRDSFVVDPLSGPRRDPGATANIPSSDLKPSASAPFSVRMKNSLALYSSAIAATLSRVHIRVSFILRSPFTKGIIA